MLTAGVTMRTLGVSSTTLNAWVKKGFLRPLRGVNRWRYFRAAEVERFRRERVR